MSKESCATPRRMTLVEALRHHAALMLAPEVAPGVCVKLMDAAVLMNEAADKLDAPVSETPLKLSYPVRQTDEHLDCLQQGNGRYLCEAGSITLAEWLVHDLNAKAPQNERVRKLEEQNMEDYTFLLNIAHDFGAKDGEDMREVIYKGIAELRAQASLSATPPKDWGRAKVGLDGNCGYALLGENLHDGEAEFVEIEGWPEPTYTQEREAWGKALRKLEARLGSGLLRYEVIR